MIILWFENASWFRVTILLDFYLIISLGTLSFLTINVTIFTTEAFSFFEFIFKWYYDSFINTGIIIKFHLYISNNSYKFVNCLSTVWAWFLMGSFTYYVVTEGEGGFGNDYDTCYCNMDKYCKSDYGGEGGGKNRPKIDYVICEWSLINNYL